MKTILLQSVEGIVAQSGMEMVAQVTPATMVGYAFAVFILCFGVYVFYRLYMDEKKYNRERSQALTDLTEKVMDVVNDVRVRLTDQKDMNQSFAVLSSKIDMAIQSINELKNKL